MKFTLFLFARSDQKSIERVKGQTYAPEEDNPIEPEVERGDKQVYGDQHGIDHDVYQDMRVKARQGAHPGARLMKILVVSVHKEVNAQTDGAINPIGF